MRKAISLFMFSFLLIAVSFSLDSNTAKLIDALTYENKDYQLIENLLYSDANILYIDTTRKQPQSIISKLVEKIWIDSWELSRDQQKYQKAISLVKLFFERGGKLQWADSEILYFALHSKMPEIVEILLRNGASPSFWISSAIGSNYRFSPLQEAYAIGDERIINLLLTFGAKDISEHEKVQIAFIEAAANSSYSVSDLINFIQKGAIINEKNANNESALMKVIDIDLLFNLFNSNQIRKYMYLLDNGADPNMTAYCSWDDGYATPLHSLIYYTSYNFKNDPNDATCIMLIDKLLKAGAFVSSTDRWGDTPLHTAAEYNNLTGANMLIAAGCKIMAKGYQGKTPLDYAKSGEMIKLLKANGATE